MSKHLLDNKSFLDLLLSTSTEQALSLLQTVTKDQLLLLSEIAKNILVLPLPKRGQLYVNKKKKLFVRLADKKLSRTKKLSLVHKNARYLLNTLLSLKAQLQSLQ